MAVLNQKDLTNHQRKQLIVIVMMFVEAVGKVIWCFSLPHRLAATVVLLSCALQAMVLYGIRKCSFNFFYPYLICNFVYLIIVCASSVGLAVLIFLLPDGYVKVVTAGSGDPKLLACQITFGVFLFSIAVVLYLYTMQMTVTQVGKQLQQQHSDNKELKIKRIYKYNYLSDVSVKPKTVYPSVLIE